MKSAEEEMVTIDKLGESKDVLQNQAMLKRRFITKIIKIYSANIFIVLLFFNILFLGKFVYFDVI